jgi:hypothetical protein
MLVWLVVLNGGNENDLQCKILSKVPCHSYSNETLIMKKNLFTNFHYHLTPHLPMVMHCKEFYKINEMLKVRQA